MLPAWKYKKKHVINNATGAGTDYQVGIKVYYGSGTDGTETVDGIVFGKVYCDSKCKTDFGDIRFVDGNELTELFYYMEKETDSDFALFWVKIEDNLSSDPSSIYIYYGNSEVATTQDLDNTFILGDNFEGDLSKWGLDTTSGTPSTSTDYPYELTKGLKGTTGKSSIGVTLAITANIAVHVRYYDQKHASKEKHILVGDYATAGYIAVDEDINANNYIYRIGSTNYDSGVARSVGWHSFIITRDDTTKTFIIDGSAMSTTTTDIISRLQLGTWWTTNAVIYYFDIIFVRKFVSPEPAHGAWYPEESNLVVNLSLSATIRKFSFSGLPCYCVLRKAGSKDLSMSFTVGKASKDLSVSLLIRHLSSLDLPSIFTLRKSSGRVLSVLFILRKKSSIDLPLDFQIRRSSSKDFPFSTTITQKGMGNLSLRFTVQNLDSRNLSSSIRIVNKGSISFPCFFNIARPTGLPVSLLVRTKVSFVDDETERTLEDTEMVTW